MSQVNVNMACQAAEAERQRLENAKRFHSRLFQRRDDLLEPTKIAILEGNTNPDHACAQLKCTPAELEPIVKDLIAAQEKRVADAELRHAHESATFKAQLEVDRADREKLAAAFATSPVDSGELQAAKVARIKQRAAELKGGN